MEHDEKWVIEGRKKLKEWLQPYLIEGWVRKDDSSRSQPFGPCSPEILAAVSDRNSYSPPSIFHVPIVETGISNINVCCL